MDDRNDVVYEEAIFDKSHLQLEVGFLDSKVKNCYFDFYFWIDGTLFALPFLMEKSL